MPLPKSGNDYNFYRCGRCKGQIPFVISKGRPKVCPECGYGHGERNVNDVPSVLRLNLNRAGNEQPASRGITEKTTITSR